ncbi:hypothetical protein AGMMS4952_21250 [Spirochaetia bacterium]|nr:hypothetical protein AGMMS4952_21250 [Spirochaetia bacterium]
MRPIDHFFSKLDSADRKGLEQEFSRLVAPVIGAAAAADLCNRIPDTKKLGAMVAFFLGEYDEQSMPLERTVLLERDDWYTIKETLEDVSGEIDINTLTSLMGELLSRGILDPC